MISPQILAALLQIEWGWCSLCSTSQVQFYAVWDTSRFKAFRLVALFASSGVFHTAKALQCLDAVRYSEPQALSCLIIWSNYKITKPRNYYFFFFFIIHLLSLYRGAEYKYLFFLIMIENFYLFIFWLVFWVFCMFVRSKMIVLFISE